VTGPLWEAFQVAYRQLRLEFAAYLDAMYGAAETDLNGVLLNRLGRTKGIDARSLFYGPFSRVEKYASEELYAWFEQGNGRRMTWEQFEKQATETPLRLVTP